MKKRTAVIMLLACLCAALLSIGASAAQTPAAASLPVSVGVTGDAPTSPETFTVRLEPVDGAPLPDGASDYADVTVTGAGEAAFTLQYSRVGIYRYKVSQLPGSDPLGTYDDTVYDVTVTVTNSAAGDALESTIAVHNNDTKPDSIAFSNSYKPSISVTVKKTWVDNGSSSRPSSAAMELLINGEVYDTVTLSEKNSWTYTWENVANKGDTWEVRENPVPTGYKASYSTDGTTVTVTNQRSLIQTGQLNWPIPVLCVLGLAAVVAGTVGLKRRREK